MPCSASTARSTDSGKQKMSTSDCERKRGCDTKSGHSEKPLATRCSMPASRSASAMAAYSSLMRSKRSAVQATLRSMRSRTHAGIWAGHFCARAIIKRAISGRFRRSFHSHSESDSKPPNSGSCNCRARNALMQRFGIRGPLSFHVAIGRPRSTAGEDKFLKALDGRRHLAVAQLVDIGRKQVSKGGFVRVHHVLLAADDNLLEPAQRVFLGMSHDSRRTGE